MSLKLKNINFRKLKISDYQQFSRLFYSCFQRKISFEFFKWRYFSNKFSFCYGAFESSNLIANVGMISIKLNDKSNNRVFSRHSSMVIKKYRGMGLFRELSKRVKKIISKKVFLIVMWPNKNNFSNFGINKKNIFKNRYYLYKTSLKTTKLIKTKYYSIDNLINFKKYIFSNNSFFFKNLKYLKDRYLSYQKSKYLINKFEDKKNLSFFIIKCNKDNSGLNYVILDHFGSKKIYSKHLSNLLNEQKKIVFISRKKINSNSYKFLNYINFKIGLIKKIDISRKKAILLNKEIFLGDTDIFLSTY